MTHTNHRKGTIESLRRDYVVFIYPARGINDEGAGLKAEEFLCLGYSHGPVNAGPARTGDVFLFDPQRVLDRINRVGSAYAVFDDKDKVSAFIKDVVKADFGVSIIVSGLIDEVGNICREAGIKRHTAQCSLGVWGKTDSLPPEEVLDITTMCGHGMISSNLVRRMTREVSRGQISFEEAAAKLARPCSCGIFNPRRTQDLLRVAIEKGVGDLG
ncbi:MAG: hypothetical protein JSV77_07500 [Dehalococcoidales bacterium]|nr:MAG: hypothetical protein JSV77_07500 [Dehalococcoidales bacterium]